MVTAVAAPKGHGVTAGGKRDWAGYYAATADRPPRETLLHALAGFAAERGPGWAGTAVDLGAGGGRDTVALLERGWRVLAIDAAPEAAMLAERPDLPRRGGLVVRTARFEAALWSAADLVNAGFALPLCPPPAFAALWTRIRASLRPGGRFAGQLYGERDDFARDPTLTCHTRAEVEALLAGLTVEMLHETEEDGVTPRGRHKHWHVFHIVARAA